MLSESEIVDVSSRSDIFDFYLEFCLDNRVLKTKRVHTVNGAE